MADFDWAAALSTSGNPASYLLELLPSIVLFIVGYSQIIVEIPRKTSRLLYQEQKWFLVALTWMVIFSAASEFLSWLVYGQPGEFISEADIIQWFGVPVGIAFLSAKYLKIRRKSNAASH